jgi:hypothetical protein
MMKLIAFATALLITSPAWAQGMLPVVPTDPAEQARYIDSVATVCAVNGLPEAGYRPAQTLEEFKACMDGANLWLKNTPPCMTTQPNGNRLAGKQGATGKGESYSNEARRNALTMALNDHLHLRPVPAPAL